MDRWIRVLILSVGGALGVNARYWLGLWMSRWVDPRFPWAIFITNVSGSFAIGFVVALMTRWLPHPYFRLLVVAGFLGGYTTFSTLRSTRSPSGKKASAAARWPTCSEA